MDSNPNLVLVREAIQLLREVRTAYCESNRGLVQSLDEAIEKLELCLIRDEGSTKRIFECLKLISQWAAALPAIERLVKSMKD